MDSITAILQLLSLQIVCLIYGNCQVCQLTESDALGPYHLHNAPFRSTVCAETPGTTPLTVEGYIIGNNCQGIRDAVLEIWQADENGDYDPKEDWRYWTMQYDYNHVSANGYQFDCRARVRSDQNGMFSFNTLIPAHYGGGSSRRPQHLHFRVSTPDGSKVDVSQMYFDFDNQAGKRPSLTVTTQDAGTGKRAVFNFTMSNAQGDVPLGNKQEPGEPTTMCYECDPCPWYYDAREVTTVQCPPSECKLWWSTFYRMYSRGCKESYVCSMNGELAWCCEGDYCNKYFWNIT